MFGDLPGKPLEPWWAAQLLFPCIEGWGGSGICQYGRSPRCQTLLCTLCPESSVTRVPVLGTYCSQSSKTGTLVR